MQPFTLGSELRNASRPFSKTTLAWWNRQIQQYEPYVSEIVLDEISRGSAAAAQLRLNAVEGFASLAVTPEVIKLAQECYTALDLPDKQDCMDSLGLDC